MYSLFDIKILVVIVFIYLIDEYGAIKSSQRSLAKNKNNRSESLTNNATNKTTDRTLSKIRTHSEDGRLVVLFCKHKCLKERADVSKLIFVV